MKKNYSSRAVPTQALKKGIKNASLLFLLFIVSVAHTNAQLLPPTPTCYVNIPDANFKNVLLSNTGINTNNDMEISCSEAAAFTGTMSVSSKDIADLTGIEAFVNITELSCRDNVLTSLAVSANTALTRLDCYNNALTSLDVSANTALTYLGCTSNALTSLDVSANTALTTLYCGSNNLTSMDVSQNTALTSLDCQNNDLTSLDVSQNTVLLSLNSSHNDLIGLNISHNTALRYLNCYNNNLTSLDVSNKMALEKLHCGNNGSNTPNNLTSLDVSANTALTSLACYNNALLTSLNVANGNNMNFTYFKATDNPNLSCIQVDDVTYSNIHWANDKDTTASFSTDCSPIVYIPDANFKNALLSNTSINTDNDTEISYNEAVAFTGTMDVSFNNIADLTGIEAFVNITRLYCNYNNLTSLEVANNLALEELRCYSNNLTSIDVSANTALTRLICYDNALTSLDVSANTTLTGLYCSNNALTSLNVANGNNTNLITFTAENNPNLSCIQVDDVTYSNANWANDIDDTASFSTDCPIVYIPDANFKNALLSNTSINTDNDTEISYNEAAAFTGTMDVSFNNIADLTGIEAFVNITRLYCNYNNLTSLEVANNLALEELRCNSNNLTSIDVSANTALTRLICYDNALTSLNVANSNNMNFTYFNATNNPDLSCIQVDDVTYSNANWANDIDDTASFSRYCFPVYIPDANFKNALLSDTSINTDNDMEISYNEAAAFTGTMNVSYKNIADLTGIEAFVNITGLNCNGNALTSLDVSANTALNDLNCMYNALTSLDVSANTALTELWCYANALASIDVSANTALTYLDCGGNALISIDVSTNTALTSLYCDENALTSLDVSANTALTQLWCSNNALTSLDVSANTALTWLWCYNNALTSIDVSANTALTDLSCGYNDLTSLDVSANTALTYLLCHSNALTSLDVSANTALTYLRCYNNALTSLNVANGNNINMNFTSSATDNPNLSCIQVDNVAYSNTNWANDIDATASFSTNCGTGKATKTKTTTNVDVATVIDSSLDNELLFNETIRISPNPVVNTLSIITPSGFQLKEAKVYNLLGKALLSSFNNKIDASSLPTGMYIVKVESTDGKIQTKKIIKE